MPLLIASFFIAMVAYLEAQILPAQAADRNTMIADAQATKFLAYRAGVVAYFADANNTCNGAANAASLPGYFSGGFVSSSADARWNNSCKDGVVYVYEAFDPNATTPPLDENLLFDKTGGTAMQGHLSAAGTFLGTKSMPLSGGIPVDIVSLINKPALIMVGG